jgi:hypothetical protein
MSKSTRPVAEATEYTIGGKVGFAHRACGRVTRVVIDPVTRTLTHLIVPSLRGTHNAAARLLRACQCSGASQSNRPVGGYG